MIRRRSFIQLAAGLIAGRALPLPAAAGALVPEIVEREPAFARISGVGSVRDDDGELVGVMNLFIGIERRTDGTVEVVVNRVSDRREFAVDRDGFGRGPLSAVVEIPRENGGDWFDEVFGPESRFDERR